VSPVIVDTMIMVISWDPCHLFEEATVVLLVHARFHYTKLGTIAQVAAISEICSVGIIM
jgi:hypothetical protein